MPRALVKSSCSLHSVLYMWWIAARPDRSISTRLPESGRHSQCSIDSGTRQAERCHSTSLSVLDLYHTHTTCRERLDGAMLLWHHCDVETANIHPSSSSSSSSSTFGHWETSSTIFLQVFYTRRITLSSSSTHRIILVYLHSSTFSLLVFSV